MKRELVSILLLLACERTDRAIEPVWGKEPCASCGMIVGDRASAAEIVTRAGDRLFFDDPGCMVVWESTHEPPQHAWVRSADDGTWLAAEGAHFRSGAKTPMDFGWQAHASGESWETMRAAVLARRPR